MTFGFLILLKMKEKGEKTTRKQTTLIDLIVEPNIV